MEQNFSINNLKGITASPRLKKLLAYADWHLLLFLILFLNVKLGVKIPILIIFYLLQPNFRFGFKIKDSRLPLFYLIILFIPFISIIINKAPLTVNYLLVLLNGLGFWLLCILAIHQIKLSVDRNDSVTLNHTLIIFFIINAVISILKLGSIMCEIGELNPYTYQGLYQKYFISTGDYIRGVTFDTSTTNAVLNALGAIYFLAKKNAGMLVVCVIVVLLAGSNFTNLILVFILVLLFLFKSNRYSKSLIAVSLMMLVFFMIKVSPQNNKYVIQTFTNIINHNKITHEKPLYAEIPLWQKPDSVLNPNERREKAAKLYLDNIGAQIAIKKGIVTTSKSSNIPVTDAGKIVIPKGNIYSATYQSDTVTPREQVHLVSFIKKNEAILPISSQRKTYPPLPGKVLSMMQTAGFIKQHPMEILAGIGLGNFSSKLAFKASGLNISGGYPTKYTYLNTAFEANHLDLYLNFFSRRSGYHSLTNSPFSVYDQLLAEYGLLGLVAFLIYYLGFFLKHYQKLSYGLPILLLVGLVLFIDYWFEQLSILIVFELLLFMDIKETSVKKIISHA